MRPANGRIGGFPWHGYAVLGLLTAATLCLCVSLGSVAVPFGDTVRAIWNAVWGMDPPQGVSRTIILNVRLPRVLAGLFAGAALAAAGVLLQAVLNNAMASPNVIGVNAGAGFFALLAMALAPAVPGAAQFAAFLGALGCDSNSGIQSRQMWRDGTPRTSTGIRRGS